ncbi:MAG TPA: hypothetical protein PKB14_07765 [Rubrivivax sp.]|nr:hypothetical protein [Rubrivivax sp.]
MRPDDALLAEVVRAAVRAALRPLHDEIDALRSELLHAVAALQPRQPVSDATARFVAAMVSGWGDVPFTTAGLIAWCEQRSTPLQRDVDAAARALCRLPADADLGPRVLGGRLRELAKHGVVRLAGERRGAAIWAVCESHIRTSAG